MNANLHGSTVSTVTAWDVPANMEFSPNTSPGSATFRIKILPSLSAVRTFARPSYNMYTPRAGSPSKNMMAPLGRLQTWAISLITRIAGSERSEKRLLPAGTLVESAFACGNTCLTRPLSSEYSVGQRPPNLVSDVASPIDMATLGRPSVLDLSPRSQKAAPDTQFTNPADLVNQFLLLANTVLFVPHDTVLRFPMHIEAGGKRDWS